MEELAYTWEVQDAEAEGCQHSGSLFLSPVLFSLRPQAPGLCDPHFIPQLIFSGKSSQINPNECLFNTVHKSHGNIAQAIRCPDTSLTNSSSEETSSLKQRFPFEIQKPVVLCLKTTIKRHSAISHQGNELVWLYFWYI